CHSIPIHDRSGVAGRYSGETKRDDPAATKSYSNRSRQYNLYNGDSAGYANSGSRHQQSANSHRRTFTDGSTVRAKCVCVLPGGAGCGRKCCNGSYAAGGVAKQYLEYRTVEPVREKNPDAAGWKPSVSGM